MSTDDPSTWIPATSAIKNMLDGFRTAVALVKDIRGMLAGADPTQAKALDEALHQAEVGAKLSEAEIAKALGFELCRCEFPPIPMLTVGQHEFKAVSGPVHECPKCGYNTAGPYRYTRIAPERVPPAAR